MTGALMAAFDGVEVGAAEVLPLGHDDQGVGAGRSAVRLAILREARARSGPAAPRRRLGHGHRVVGPHAGAGAQQAVR